MIYKYRGFRIEVQTKPTGAALVRWWPKSLSRGSGTLVSGPVSAIDERTARRKARWFIDQQCDHEADAVFDGAAEMVRQKREGT